MLNGSAELLGMLNGRAAPVAGPTEGPEEEEDQGSGGNDPVGGGPTLGTVLGDGGTMIIVQDSLFDLVVYLLIGAPVLFCVDVLCPGLVRVSSFIHFRSRHYDERALGK